MSWWSAAPELVLATLWLMIPGLALAWSVGVRGLTGVLVAPAVSVGLLAGWAVVLSLVGIRWTALNVAVAVALTVVAAFAVRRAAELRGRGRTPGHGARPPVAVGGTARADRTTAWLTAVGAVVGALFSAVPVAVAMGRPDLPAQFWDVVFHLNATRYVLESGDASSLTVGAVNDQVATGHVFYPAGWHAVASLSTTESVVVSSNALVLVVVGLVFSLGLAAFARAVLPDSRYLGLFAPLAGAAVLSFPAGLTAGGGIWPSVLSTALVPAAVSCGVVVLRRSQPGRLAWTVLLLGALGGVATAQPSGLLTFAAVLSPLVLARCVAVVREAVCDRSGAARALTAVGATAGAVAWTGFWWLVWRMFAAQVADDKWRGTAGFWQGVRAGILDSPSLQVDGSMPVRAVMLALLAVGVLVALATRGTRWLVPALAALLALAGLSEADNSLLWVVMPWFSGPNRLLGGVPVVSALVTGLALAAIAQGLVRLARPLVRGTGVSDGGADGKRGRSWRPSSPSVVATAAAVVVALGFVAASDGLRAREHTILNEPPYKGMLALEDGNLADADELAMIERLRGQLEPGALMIGDPFRGSGLAYAISGVPVVFPHLGGRWSPDARFLALHLMDIHQDPEVCAAIGRLGVGYLYTDAIVYLPWHGDRVAFDGIPVDPPQPGFELIDRGGHAAVWRITACD